MSTVDFCMKVGLRVEGAKQRANALKQPKHRCRAAPLGQPTPVVIPVLTIGNQPNHRNHNAAAETGLLQSKTNWYFVGTLSTMTSVRRANDDE